MGFGRLRISALALIILMFCLSTGPVFCPSAQAEEPGNKGEPAKAADKFQGIDVLIEVLREKNILTKEEAATIISRIKSREDEAAAKKAEAAKAEQAKPIEVVKRAGAAEAKPGVTPDGKPVELAKAEPDKKKVPAAWTDRVRWGGDIRLRYQADIYDNDNAQGVGKPSNPTEQMNTTEDRHQFRYRARLKVQAKVEDNVEAGITLASGSSSSPVSTNESMGDSSAKDDVWIDQAFIKFTPIKELTLWGGRFQNPYSYTDLVWDNDLNFEGMALQLAPWRTYKVRPFMNLGAFAVQEVELSEDDKWLFGGQLGLEADVTPQITTKLALAYYDYRNIEGKRNDLANPGIYNYTAPLYQQKGNTLMDIDPTAGERYALAADYNLVNLSGHVDFGFFDPVHVILFGDYVKNIGFDKDEVKKRTLSDDIKEDTMGYQVGLLVGHKLIKGFPHWRVGLAYKYLESDAVVDAYTDSDFHEGGTNAQGWILSGEFGIYDNTWLAMKWLTSDEIDGLAISMDTLQLDLNVRF